MINKSVQRYFLGPIIVSVVVLALVGFFVGSAAFITAALLALLEVTLSFDNAIVNAKVLEAMSPQWQKRFLTWGILFAVVGTRLILPILVVSIIAGISPILISQLVVYNPEMYAQLLGNTHHAINAFGTGFLAMLALKYFFNVNKRDHWIGAFEAKLSKLGSIEEIEIGLVLILLLVVSFASGGEGATILSAGIVGLLLFIIMEGVIHTISTNSLHAVQTGLAGFIYLNVLDSAFSLDGVIGAFAISSNVLVIAVGLGIGAYFVRVLTMYMVQEKTINSIKYLEHGAHWAILGLALCMAASLVFHVPEVLIALIGLCIIGASFVTSLR
ncbi:MAG: hypothetical protein JWO50_836 [Candidatus Kaiserbacteria bacterium]|nr:hypothetical protein [Candidatus Kaiserbacteria bacterium]